MIAVLYSYVTAVQWMQQLTRSQGRKFVYILELRSSMVAAAWLECPSA